MGTGSVFMLVPIVPTMLHSAMLHCYTSKHMPANDINNPVPEEIKDTI